MAPARSNLAGCRREGWFLQAVHDESCIEAISQENTQWAVEEPLRLRLTDDAFRLPGERCPVRADFTPVRVMWRPASISASSANRCTSAEWTHGWVTEKTNVPVGVSAAASSANTGATAGMSMSAMVHTALLKGPRALSAAAAPSALSTQYSMRGFAPVRARARGR